MCQGLSTVPRYRSIILNAQNKYKEIVSSNYPTIYNVRKREYARSEYVIMT